MSDSTLEDVVLHILQLEPGDRDDFGRAREQLAELAFGGRLAIAAQPLVAGAMRAIKPLADGTAADPAAAFAEASALLERALGVAPLAAPTSAPARAPESPARVPERDAGVSVDTGDGGILPADIDLDLLADFLAESRDCLGGSEAALLSLERTPDDVEAVNTVFRAFHTIKGTSAFLGLTRMTTFAHGAESLLARVREGTVAYTSGCAELALRSVDMLKTLLEAVEEAVRAGAPGAALPLPEGYAALVSALASYDGSAVLSAVVSAVAPVGDGSAGDRPAPDVSDTDRRVSDRRQDERRQSANSGDADQFLRVRTERLDRLVDMVSELVIAHAMIAGDEALAAAAAADHGAAKKLGHAGKIVRGLQELSMGMRMVPLRATFQKMTRLVRDVSAKVAKPVDFVTEGDDTEIDRTLVALVGDPLVHMVRNAIDHGIETPAERAAAGKPPRGTVRLSAYHAGGSVVVELVDDGRGLHRDRIVRKAIEKGLIATDQGMTDADVFGLIFAPGFSTVDAVTDLSGRGVGMDVVRRNVERVRGRVDITSRAGEGSTFTLRLPLTLAVTDGMLVRVGAERYVVPTTSIHVSFRPEPGAVRTIAGRGEVVTLRGEVMPVVRLHRLFRVHGAEPDPTRALLMVVGDGRRRRTALLVDELLSQQQVVAKSLGEGVGRVEGVAGGAILGDGRVGLILDIAEVVALAERGEALATPAACAA